jgi:hypothetical protein
MPPVVRGVGQHGLAEQSLGHGSAEQIRDLCHLNTRVQGALPNQNRELPPAVQHIGGDTELIGRGWLTTRIHEDEVRAPGLPMEHLSAARRII